MCEKFNVYTNPLKNPQRNPNVNPNRREPLTEMEIQSIGDDYSRGYMALCVFPMKHPYFVVLSMLQSFRLHSKPKLFHHDNGGEYKNGVISRLLKMLDIVDVLTIVDNPKGNGKKEKAHSQDRKFFMINISFRISKVSKKQFRNISDSEMSRKDSGHGMDKPHHLH